jgi:hypothetical protein
VQGLLNLNSQWHFCGMLDPFAFYMHTGQHQNNHGMWFHSESGDAGLNLLGGFSSLLPYTPCLPANESQADWLTSFSAGHSRL